MIKMILNDSEEQPDSMDLTDNSFELLDGRRIMGFPKPEPSETIDNRTSFDTTGEFLSLNGRTPATDEVRKFRTRYYHNLFSSNVRLFIDRAEEIMSDSRMFLTPANVHNGLAYTGTSGFRGATVGVYLEWWQNCPEASIDANGNPIWFISGSPLTGSNACESVDAEGRDVRSVLNGGFSAVWTTFCGINRRYDGAKSRFEALTLEELLIRLHGEEYRPRLEDFYWQMILDGHLWAIDYRVRSFDNASKSIQRMVRSTRKMLIQIHLDEIKWFYTNLANAKPKLPN